VLTEKESRYLMEIYESYLKGMSYVGPQYIAERMNVKRPSAYEALQKLLKKGILKNEHGKYIITEEGMHVAKRILRTHRIIETMLYRAGVELDKACECASRIQNEFTEDMIEKICEYLGYPKHCPHGKPIPEVKK